MASTAFFQKTILILILILMNPDVRYMLCSLFNERSWELTEMILVIYFYLRALCAGVESLSMRGFAPTTHLRIKK